MKKRFLCVLLTLTTVLSLSGCAGQASEKSAADSGDTASEAVEEAAQGEEAASDVAAEKNGDVIILFTSDVHCGVDDGFGYGGLYEIRQSLERRGYTTILVDDGDCTQGEPVGVLSKGEDIIDIMNVLEYDFTIPGNHDFDYGMDHFYDMVDKADFEYLCCNLTKDGEKVLAPYAIKEAAGMKIGFVGVTTPATITSSTPRIFQDEKGNYIYGFEQDETGEKLYAAVQDAVDSARADGAEYVYLIAHLGNEIVNSPWTYAEVIENTSGIDVVLDGHSHDTEQVVMQNKDGEDVVRSAVGTKFANIGYSLITAEDGIKETDLYKWSDDRSAVELFGFENPATVLVEEKLSGLSEELDKVIAKSDVDLTIYDPEEVDSNGNKLRTIRFRETNLGDFVADAYRQQGGADIGLVNGGGVRDDIHSGDITYGDLMAVHPFSNQICVVEATGQQILDALEWGARAVPNELGGFLQVSGLTYEIDPSIESGCKEDEYSMCIGIEGPRRVQNVMVGDEPIDPKKTYTVASHNYLLFEHGDGFTAFDGCIVVRDGIKLDNQALTDYVMEALGGTIGDEYSDPYGQGRIVVK